MQDRFELPAELNIYNAIASRDALSVWVSKQRTKGGQPLAIVGANVAEVDGSGLQLLAALSSEHISWQLLEASPALADACRTMGCAQWLQAADAPTPSAQAKPVAKAKTLAKAKSRKESAP